MIRKTFLVVTLFLMFQGCKAGTSEILKNEKINQNTRAQLSALNNKLFKAIAGNDAATVKAMMSDKLLEKDEGNIEKLVKDASASLSAKNYSLLDEYHVKNSTTGVGNTLFSGLAGNNDYIIHYLALNKEMYVSLLLPGDGELLITAIYGNYNNQWKINILYLGQYRLEKLIAPDYYKQALDSYNKSYLVDAANYLVLAQQCLKPGGEYFQYLKEKDINDLSEKVMKEVNAKYIFPLTLENIDTKPKVFRIYPQIMGEGIFPCILYVTRIDLTDVVALKAENEKVRIEAAKLFNGIDKDKKAILYRAFAELPDGVKEVKSYGFVDEK
ncbi:MULTISPECIES: hypothetical protein [unclassified Pedobacter]|uniref:hypothetical protein n=1 Tax=unclassified Pedobacter TaxID=2628915 RepID=UPI001D672A03|nr:MULTISPECIES: hypothetical protein [unclassified Pedobacter]CAH0169478.1 hypothetical protein SRABI126_00992 [Pedobacter sp. Bi126]CAH0287492.1 hypothetical protein SRABI36_04203 [Pedobacter sp. Bi36]